MSPRRSLLLALFWIAPVLAAPAPVIVIPVEGAIGPATADFVHRGLERAAKEGAQLVVLRLDTPGGLDSAMREIIKDILASPVPVAGFVGPSGARAASAGTFILYAAHIAAMAPATNLGAASPVAIGMPSGGEPAKGEKKGAADKDAAAVPADTMMRKQMNDAAAYIRGLAQLRGRNAQWAERAVREAVSLPAAEALKLKVVDMVADDIGALLKQVDGRRVGNVTLQTADAKPVVFESDWRTRLLSTITNPSVAYLLVLLGIYAIVIEFTNPGMVLPGVVGVLCVLIAMYAFHLLPVNYAGLVLILVGIGFMIAEVFLPAYGSLGIGGVVAFAIGSVMLIDTDVPEFEIPYGLIAGLTAASAAFLLLMVGLLVRGRRRPVVSGREELIGFKGEALGEFTGEGWARIHGETWRVRSAAQIKGGQRVRVTAMRGLVLEVVPEPGERSGG